MINTKRYFQLLLLGAVFISFPGFADDAASPVPKSQNVTINLINRLVKKGVLSEDDAKDLIQQAEKDAAEASTQAAKPETDQTTNDTVSVPVNFSARACTLSR